MKTKFLVLKEEIINIISKHSPEIKHVDVSDAADELISRLDIKERFSADKNDFDKAVEPAIRFLLRHHNPHTKIHINYSSAELLQGQMCYNLNSEIPD